MVTASLGAKCNPGLGLRSSTGAILLGQFAISGDLFDCHSAREIGCYWHQASGGHPAGDAAEHRVRYGTAPHTEGLSRPRRQSCGGEGLMHSESLKEGGVCPLAVLVVTISWRCFSASLPGGPASDTTNHSLLKFSLSASKSHLCWLSSTSLFPPHMRHTLSLKPVVPGSWVALHKRK